MKRFFGLLFLLFALNVYAADQFVDKDSSCVGDNGSSTDPWCSISAAALAVSPGDVVKIRNSPTCYDENVIWAISGTSGSRITVQPDTGHTPCIRFTGTSLTTGAFDLQANYYTIQNLTFNAADISPVRYAIMVNANTTERIGITITGNSILNWGNATDRRFVSIGSQTNGTNFVRELIITNNTITDGRSRGISIEHTIGAVVEGNTITGLKCGFQSTNNLGAQGIKVGEDGQDNIVRNNLVTDHSLSCTGISAGSGTPFFVGVYCDTGPVRTIIEGNYIEDIVPGGSTTQDGVGIFNESRCHNTVVRRNFVNNIGRYGLRNGSSSTGDPNDSQWLNNTVLNVAASASGGGAAMWLRRGFRTIIKNNILGITSAGTVAIDVNTTATAQGPHQIDYNLYYDSLSNTKIGRWGGSTLTFANWKAACDATESATNPCDSHSPTPTDPLLNANGTQTSTSPGRDIGTTLSGILCNGTCDIGRYESINSPAPTCSVEDGDANTVRVTFTNNTAPDIQTGGNVTGITVQVNSLDRTESAPTKVGTNEIYYTISGASVSGTDVVTWAAASNNAITDSSDAGAPTVAQGLHATGAITCTNNVGTATTFVFTQSAIQFYSPALVSGVLETRPINAAVNTDVRPVPGSTIIVAAQLDCTTADCPGVGAKWQYQLNGGSFTDMPDSFGADNVKFHGANENGWAQAGHAIAACLSGALTPTSGSVQITSAAIPNFDLPQNGCIVLGAMIDFDTDVVAGDAYRFKLVLQDGTAITVTSNPDANIIGHAGSTL